MPGYPIGRSKKFWSLIKKGPQTEVNPNPEEKRLYDIRKFSISMSGRTKNVYYLNQYHSNEEILRMWLEVNEGRIKKSSISKMQFRVKVPGEFEEAFYNLYNEYSGLFRTTDHRKENGGDKFTNNDKACPYCGESITVMYSHILNECKEVNE